MNDADFIAFAGGCDCIADMQARFDPYIPLFTQYEYGFNQDGGTWFATDPFWALPNTYPLMVFDTRQQLTAGGNGWTAPPGNVCPAASFRAGIVARMQWFFSTADWPATKPKRWGMVIVGPDASTPGLPLFFDPADVVGAGGEVISVFPATGVAACAAYFASVVDGLAEAVASAGLSQPEVVVTDLEKHGSYYGNMYSGQGVFPAAIADARAGTYLIDGTRTLNQWLAERTLDRNGNAYPAYTGGAETSAAFFHSWQRAIAMVDTAYIRGIHAGILSHFKAIWPNIITGEWGFGPNSRANPTFNRMPGYHYDMDGGFSGLDACPINYSQPDFAFEGTGLPAHLGTYENWAAALGTQALPAEDYHYRMGRDAIKALVPQWKSVTGSRVLPSLSLGDDAGSVTDQDLARRVEQLSGSIADSVAAGVNAVWLYASPPAYPSSAAVRQAYVDLVARATARIITHDFS